MYLPNIIISNFITNDSNTTNYSYTNNANYSDTNYANDYYTNNTNYSDTNNANDSYTIDNIIIRGNNTWLWFSSGSVKHEQPYIG